MSISALITLSAPLSGLLLRCRVGGAARRPLDLAARLVMAALARRLRHHNARTLAALDDRLLADIGVRREDIAALLDRSANARDATRGGRWP